MQYIRNNWFDVGTAAWAIALVVMGTLWMTAAPAFAQRGEEDCWDVCEATCGGLGGCETIGAGGGPCWGTCGNGESWGNCEP